MKNCTNCGKENLDDAVFCAACGTPLPAAEAQQPVTETEQPAPEVQQEPAPAPAADEMPLPVQVVDSSAYSAPAAPAVPAESNKAILWLILNIVATLICCLINPFGIIGIIFAAIGMSSYSKGNYEDMRSKSKIAMIMFIIGIAVALLTWILSFAGMFALPLIGALRAISPY